jgi:hydroxyacylglutathione hydrolase
MTLDVCAVGPFFKNGFLLGCDHSREAVIIDPGDEIEELLGIAAKKGLRVGHLLLTHAHMDHLSGLRRAKHATGGRIGVHRADLFLYDAAVQQGRTFGYDVDPPPPPDFFYDPDMLIAFGACQVHVHHTPGHSPGGVCLRVATEGDPAPRLFVGDTLFAGSIGRTDLPGGDYDRLLRSIKETLFAFGDQAVVYPGHGPQTTIGDERRTNPFLAD